ncbi:hypothetical protein GM708_12425 [Vibrio cholerae]|nr:hypothetical protein [Vibrio cholerae]
MGVLRIDTDRYGEAADVAAEAGRGVDRAVLSTHAALLRTSGMAGWDTMGTEWAASYDPVAREVLEACNGLALASSDTSRALTCSAGNYISAEHVASMGLSPLVQSIVPGLLPGPGVPLLPSASAADPGWPPPGWDIVAGIAGVVWPAGDPALLRAAGTTWDALATDIEASITPFDRARIVVEGLLADDLRLFRERTAALQSSGALIACAARDLATGCSRLAAAVEAAHQELTDEVQAFAVECATLAGVGVALSFVTLGGSAAITSLVGAARTAQMIARVHQVLARLLVLARSVSALAVRLPGAARLTAGLQPLAGTVGTVLRSVRAVGRAAPGGAPMLPGGLSFLAPAVRIVRPLGSAGIRALDSRAVSVALSNPAALAREHLSWQVRRRLLGTGSVRGGTSDQVLAMLRNAGLGSSPAVPAMESALRIKGRVETAAGLTALPSSLRKRYAPGPVPGLEPQVRGPGRLTAVQVSPVPGPTAESTRARRTSHPAASP